MELFSPPSPSPSPSPLLSSLPKPKSPPSFLPLMSLHLPPPIASSAPWFAVPASAAAAAVSPAAIAVSYDDISFPSSPFPSSSPPDLGLDVAGILDSVSSFVADNPLALVAGASLVAIPLVISSLFSSQDKTWGSVSAREVFNKLEDPDALLLDIRIPEDIKAEGTPDLRSLKKRVFQIPYAAGEDEDAFLKKLLTKFKDPPSTTLYILDQFDGNSISVAKLCAANGFKFSYAIKDGAEGPNGWRKNELPWILPRKGFSLDLSSLKDVIDNTFADSKSLVPATLGVAAAAGVSFVVFSEAETALQLLGSAALVQIFVKKLLFAKDRQKTLQELQAFLDTKVAPKELVDELKGLSGTLLPKYQEVPTNGAITISEPTQEVEVQSEVIPEQKDAESKAYIPSTDLPRSPTPLSPYTQFPDLKPPSFPTSSGPIQEVEVQPEVIVEQKDAESKAYVPSTDLPLSATPLSPYTQFPDLKPPSFSTSSGPIKEVEVQSEVILEQKDAGNKACSPSTDLPRSATPLSPYTQFPDLKPPSFPTPSKP